MQNILDSISKQLQKDPNVLGVLLFGSLARKTFDKFSDIDIYVVTSKPGKHARHNYVEGKVRVDMIVDSISEALDYLKKDRHAVRRNMSHMLAHGKILFAKDSALSKLQKIAKENLKPKTVYTKREVLMHLYSIDDFLGECRRNAQNNDRVAFGMNSDLLINNIIELFLKIKGKYFLRPNEMPKVFRKSDKAFGGMVTRYYGSDTVKSRLSLLVKMSDYVTGIAGGFPSNWKVK